MASTGMGEPFASFGRQESARMLQYPVEPQSASRRQPPPPVGTQLPLAVPQVPDRQTVLWLLAVQVPVPSG